MKQITPLSVYKAWPHHDLLGCNPPEPGMTFRQYYESVKDTAGDLLFLFVLAECDDDISDEERLTRITAGAADLDEVAFNLSEI